MAANAQLGGGTNSRPLNDTLAETGPGLPDDAIGPEQRSLADQTELAEGPEAEAMTRKLAAEAAARMRTDEDAAADPTGHA